MPTVLDFSIFQLKLPKILLLQLVVLKILRVTWQSWPICWLLGFLRALSFINAVVSYTVMMQKSFLSLRWQIGQKLPQIQTLSRKQQMSKFDSKDLLSVLFVKVCCCHEHKNWTSLSTYLGRERLILKLPWVWTLLTLALKVPTQSNLIYHN